MANEESKDLKPTPSSSNDGQEILKPQGDISLPLNPSADMLGALTNLTLIKNFQSVIGEHINAPFNVPTPKEKVRKRPDGFDYVEGSFMDLVAKNTMPLYEYSLLHVSIEHGWINIIVSLKDRVTGNVELGADAARIQVRKDAELPNFRDIIDMGNNIKSALTKAIKNAQSRFGIAADIYQRREEVPSDDERTRFAQLYNEIKSISLAKAKLFEEQWNSLGIGYSDLLDQWTVYVKNNQKAEDAKVVKDKPISI